MDFQEFDPGVMAEAVANNRVNAGLPPQNGLSNGKNSLAFVRTRDHGRIAFKAYMAIYNKRGQHVIVAAPDLDALATAWDGITGVPLDRTSAQEVFIVSTKYPGDGGLGPIPSTQNSETRSLANKVSGRAVSPI